MRVFLNVMGLVSYAISLYIMFVHDATDYDSPFRIVGGDSYNYTYS
jgi:hypothetical protein